MARFGRNIDELLEYAKKIVQGGTLIIPLIQDDTIPNGILNTMPTGVNVAPASNLQDPDAFLTQNEARTYLSNERVDVADKVPRFFSFNDIFTDGSEVETPDPDGEPGDVVDVERQGRLLCI